ncbi:MAG: hypothetical protein KAH32_04605 [Chlamydiia bacterium]|nr:hypothetical protein [Chlamydiia bacterium]
MFVPEFKPKIYLGELEVDNVSPDKKVIFLEQGHHYFHIDDIIDNKLVAFKKSKYEFKSPTGILSAFKEKFDSERISEQYVKKHNLDISALELRKQWEEKARVASDRGSKLHAYCESIYDKWDFGSIPDEPQARHAEDALRVLESGGWKLIQTELLVYNTKLKLAGQVDLLLKKRFKDSKGNKVTRMGIFDYKFLKEPIQKKSFYNYSTKKYKMMTGPFKHLMDCNYFHYSIQMELYRMLMGKAGKKVARKTLVIMTEDDYNFVEGYDMKIWVDNFGTLQAKYKLPRGDMYDSSKDEKYDRDEPYQIINI